MEENVAAEIKRFLSIGKLPGKFKSNKWNFIAMAGKYNLNKKQMLVQDNRPVVTKNMEQKIYSSLHLQSGRTATWNRIKAR